MLLLSQKGGGDGCHLRVVPTGQFLRRPRTPSPCDRRMFRDLLNFVCSICKLFSHVWTVFLYVNVLLHFLMFNFSSICVVKFLSNVFFMVFFPIARCFAPRLLCLLSNSFLHCYQKYSGSLVEMVQWFLFGILVMFGMSERSHCHIISFSFHCFNGFSVASCVTVQDVRERPLTYN